MAPFQLGFLNNDGAGGGKFLDLERSDDGMGRLGILDKHSTAYYTGTRTVQHTHTATDGGKGGLQIPSDKWDLHVFACFSNVFDLRSPQPGSLSASA